MVVLDSSFLVAYYNRRDALHADAARAMVQFAGGAWGQGILLEYVFLEVVTVLRMRAGIEAATDAGSILLNAREIVFRPCSDVFVDGWEFFQRSERDLSLADSAIAITALRDSDGRVLTFDSDFKAIPGIRRLPG